MKTNNQLLSVTIAATITLSATGLFMMSQRIMDLPWSTASIRTSQMPDGFDGLL